MSTGLALFKWNNPIKTLVPSSHRIDAGVDLVATAAQAGLGIAAFAVVIDRLRQSSEHYDQLRQLPESFRWIALLLDQVGTIVVDIATMMPLGAAKVKAVLVAIGAVGKGGGLAFTILEVTSNKFVLEPARPPG